MNKLIISSLLLGSICVASAGTQPIASLTSVEPAQIESPYSISVKGGLMYQSVNTVDGENSGLVPSLLYGGSLGFNYDLVKKDAWTQSVGFSFGYYNGKNAHLHDYTFIYDFNNLALPGSSSLNLYTELTTIPLVFSYDVKREITGSVSGYFGARAGAMIRKTDIKGVFEREQGEKPETPDVRDPINEDSTRIVPMIGFGFGVKSYLSANWTLDLGVDCMWTFGRDCDTIRSSIERIKMPGVKKDCRFSAVFTVGATYTF